MAKNIVNTILNKLQWVLYERILMGSIDNTIGQY